MADADDLFHHINNAVLDLQASQLQTFSRPLKTLSNLLHHVELEAINKTLTEGLDLDAFLSASEATRGGMLGSGSLAWPEDHEKALGLALLLIDKFADDPDLMRNIGYSFFYSGNNSIISVIHSITRQIIIPFVRDYKNYVLGQGRSSLRIVRSMSSKVFIVHGHDAEARETVARFLGNIGFEPIILHEQANRGRTVIEKVEANSDVSFAVVLLTPDDEGCAKGGTPEPRPRQNVLLELGYFMALLGRDRVCALRRGEVEIPSDFAGVIWEVMDDNGGWKQKLGRELEAAGHQIDWNKVMR